MMIYCFEDPAFIITQADVLFKTFDGFGRARGYCFGTDVNVPLFTVAYQKMWCLSKIEACHSISTSRRSDRIHC
jgi:hypothetical protein